MHFQANLKLIRCSSKWLFLIKGWTIACLLILLESRSMAVTLSEKPLDAAYRPAPPVVMFVFDDSTSMDWELMTPESDGVIKPGNDKRHYIFNELKLYNAWQFNSSYLSNDEKNIWKIQWSGYNAIYYSPFITYDPWPDPSGVGTLPNADMDNPYTDPISSNPRTTIDLSDNFSSLGEIDIKNSHYYLAHVSENEAGVKVYSDIYLVNLVSSETREYYRVTDNNGDGYVNWNELAYVTSLPESYDLTLTPAEDLQNFANWFTYYRKRVLSAKASVSKTIARIDNIYIGFYSINGELQVTASAVKILNQTDQTQNLLTSLYELDITIDHGTPLRNGLATVGEYYRGNSPASLGGSPYASANDGGECQLVYALVITDGYWNGEYTVNSGALSGDVDHDGYSDTLADVALAYFLLDLRPDLQNDVFPSACDVLLAGSHDHLQQRLVTFSVSFGVSGTLDPGPEAYNTCTLEDENGNKPPWQNPLCDTDGDGDLDDNCPNKIDDLWHAAANTTGVFFNASDTQELTRSLLDIFGTIGSRQITGASISVNIKKFRYGTKLFQCFYDPSNWTGNLRAYDITYRNNTLTISSAPIWRAEDTLTAIGRTIVTYDPESGTGIPFTWTNLKAEQKAQLETNETDQQNVLNYVRGQEISGYRNRSSLLGDIVHSSPLIVGNTIYVGANDGMLHAFNKSDGTERFAYVPNALIPKLKYLKDNPYEHHRYYVDQTPVCSDIVTTAANGNAVIKNYLVGGYGAGGRGYYCLDITHVDETTVLNEETMSGYVKWEFTNLDEPELGYTFSTPVIVRTYSTVYPYVVIFGNGYNSDNGQAQLFVLNAETGDLLYQIETVDGVDNGMSSPIATDINNDQIADFVYAGDLNGNIWKFDFRNFDKFSMSSNQWDPILYKNSTGDPLPLFTTVANQPITTRPDVMRHPSKEGYIVCFGTGRYLNAGDLSIDPENVQALYGIWDFGEGAEDYLGQFDPGSAKPLSNLDSHYQLLQQTIGSCEGTGAEALDPTATAICSSSNVPSWLDPSNHTAIPAEVSHVGWYLNLRSNLGERIIQDVSIYNNMLTALSKIPPQDPCSLGGTSTFYFLNPSTGGMISAALQYDGRVLNPPVQIDPSSGESRIIFDNGGGPPSPPPNGVGPGQYMWKDVSDLN